METAMSKHFTKSIDGFLHNYASYLKTASFGLRPTIAGGSSIIILSGTAIAFVQNSSVSKDGEILCKGVFGEGMALMTAAGFNGYLKCLTCISYFEIPNSVVEEDPAFLKLIFHILVDTETSCANFEIALQRYRNHSAKLKYILGYLARLGGFNIAPEDATRIYVNLHDIICLGRVSRRNMSRLYFDLAKKSVLDLRKEYLWVSNGYFC